jgi:hypothetical protein
MSQQVTTGAGSTTTFVIRWVQEMQVDALVNATDNFNLLLTITLAFLAAAAAAGIALGAGALHPVLIYLILAGCGGCAALAGVLTWRENTNVREARVKIRAATTEYHVPFTLSAGASASPTVTIGEKSAPAASARAAPTEGVQADLAVDPGDQPRGSDADPGG